MEHFDFMPHGMCYLWKPELLALHVISDALITLSYFSIPFSLLYFVRRRRDLEFNWMIVCFAVFIIACGASHLMEIVTVWQPVYWLSGAIKAVTALASVPTAILLARLLPQALALPTPSSLRREIQERERAEQEVRRANEALESRVAERTAELEAMNVRLRAQLAHLRLLDQTTKAIGERQDLPSIFHAVLGSVEENGVVDVACICVRTEDPKTVAVGAVGARSLETLREVGLSEGSLAPSDETLARAFEGEFVCVPEIAGSRAANLEKLHRAAMNSAVIAPIIVENQAFGVMVCARRAADGFTTSDCEFLRQLTAHVGLAANQARLYDSLQRAYEDLHRSQQTVLQQERLRALGQMASGIAHDINNALSPAALYTQMLRERDATLTPESRERLAIIQRAIEDVANTVARMREFYRPREARAERAPVQAGELLHQVVELTRARWSDMPQERGVVIRLEEKVEQNLPPILGDETEIRDAVTNLILNAVDAMPEGGQLTLRAFRRAARVGIEVTDTGIGMSDDLRARCLEPFFTTKGERGTGLGLAMVYGMARRHDAALEVDSVPGQGTTIRLLFPAGAATPTRAPQPSAPGDRPLRILVVDDDPLLLRSVSEALTADGHRVETALGGRAGIDAFTTMKACAEPFDLVLTDLGMPHVDGSQVAKAIKSASPGTPVVLLSGWGHRLADAQQPPPHVDRVLSKPPKIADLRKVLQELT